MEEERERLESMKTIYAEMGMIFSSEVQEGVDLVSEFKKRYQRVVSETGFSVD